MSFKIEAADGEARAGILQTPHGAVATPVFMPVATQGSIKALDSDDIRTLGIRAILANSYHLYLRPGAETIRHLGGLHRFMDYEHFVLTDSGGFQVLSLPDFREVDDAGVTFRSHLDGSTHRLTPESVIAVQCELGADGWTTLDECPPYPADAAHAGRALERTMRWIDLSNEAVAKARSTGAKSLYFPILQGGFHPELRRRAGEHMKSTPGDGVALGGFSVGEPKDVTWRTISETVTHLPADRVRYLMGVGTPQDLWDAVACGIDMLDCVYPTRVARTGQVMYSGGKYTITNQRFRRDESPLDLECDCFVCKRYSRAYLGHLLRARELSAYRLLSYHNLRYMALVAEKIRESIVAKRFQAAREEFLSRRAA